VSGSSIRRVSAREVLDSRGRPTVEVTVELERGGSGRASVPSGVSTGRYEAVELRDGDPDRYDGRGVLKAVGNVVGVLGPALVGMDALDQEGVDRLLVELDGTPEKSRLGANAVLGASLAVARAGARARNVALWRHLAAVTGAEPQLPLPMVNMISGGLHAGRNLDLQDFLIVPLSATSFAVALEQVVTVHARLGSVLSSRGLSTLRADEGGYGPDLPNHTAALDLVCEAIEASGLVPGEDVGIAIDAASTHFWDADRGTYELHSEGARSMDAADLVELFADWCARYPIVSIEDPLSEDDWDGWALVTARLGDAVQLLGDDLFATNLARLERGIAGGAANAVLVKMNQVGTLSETLAVIRRAHGAGMATVVSGRSGETEDPFMADLAVAARGGQCKIGSVTQSERLAKYNQLLRIEGDLGPGAAYAGRDALPRWRGAPDATL
jgi:enolase